MEEEKINALFQKWCEGTEQDKAEVAAILRKPESVRLICSDTFVRVAKRWAETVGIPKMTDAEAEAYDLKLVVEICPCCGQEMEN